MGATFFCHVAGNCNSTKGWICRASLYSTWLLVIVFDELLVPACCPHCNSQQYWLNEIQSKIHPLFISLRLQMLQ